MKNLIIFNFSLFISLAWSQDNFVQRAVSRQERALAQRERNFLRNENPHNGFPHQGMSQNYNRAANLEAVLLVEKGLAYLQQISSRPCPNMEGVDLRYDEESTLVEINNSLVQRCMSQTYSGSVNQFSKHRCSDSLNYQSLSRFDYQVSSNSIIINLKLHIPPSINPGDFLGSFEQIFSTYSQARRNFQSCKSQIETYILGNTGIDLQLDFVDDVNSAHHEVRIHLSQQGRSSSNNWFLNDHGFDPSAYSVCPVMMHEVLHLLGLPDSYPETDSSGNNLCPYRIYETRTSPPYSIMTDQHDISELAIYPRDTALILMQFCPMTPFHQ